MTNWLFRSYLIIPLLYQRWSWEVSLRVVLVHKQCRYDRWWKAMTYQWRVKIAYFLQVLQIQTQSSCQWLHLRILNPKSLNQSVAILAKLNLGLLEEREYFKTLSNTGLQIEELSLLGNALKNQIIRIAGIKITFPTQITTIVHLTLNKTTATQMNFTKQSKAWKKIIHIIKTPLQRPNQKEFRFVAITLSPVSQNN